MLVLDASVHFSLLSFPPSFSFPSTVSALGGLAQNDTIVKNLLTTAIKAMGLPDSMAGMLTGADTKMPDQNKMIGDIMKSADVKKGLENQQSPVSLDQGSIDKAKDEAPNNGFRPLGSKR